MARLSTGQAYGDTNRSTAAQLLGGIPVDGFTGAIAQGSINEPALQPQARPVSTFQQTGAPTLGGPVKFFPLPDLPTPSQDLARLATALGNFNPVLTTLGETYIQQQKNIDAKAQAVGQAAAMRLQQSAPGQDFIQARDGLWRQAQAGDAGAAAAYQQMQALSPLQQAYAARYAGQAVLREDIATATERFKTITEIGGVPINQIEPGDPRISAAKSALYRVPTNDPTGFAELMPLVAAKNGEIDRLHMGMRLERKVNEASSAGQASLTSQFMGADVDVARTVADQTQMLTNARRFLGVEEYQKLVGNYGDWLSSAVLAGSMGKDGKADVQRYHNLMGKAIDVFTQVQAGPNGELLLTTLGAKGGTAAQLALTQKMMSQLKTFNESVNSFNGAIGEDKGSEILSATKADDPNLTPAQRDAAFVQADLMVQSLPEDQRQGAWEKVNKARSQANTSWTKPMQDRIEREVSFSYDKNPGTEIAKLEQLKLNGMIDPRSADRQIANYRQLQSADMRPYVNAAKTAVTDILKQETDSMKLPGSEGGAIITERERLFLINRSAELSSSVEVLRRQSMADGSGASGFSGRLGAWVKEQKPQAPKPANPSMQPLMPQGPEAWARSLGLGQMGPGNRAANYQLRQRVDNGAVMPQKEYIKNYDQYIETGRLSDSMKLLIKRSGYGATPSQFFFKQWDKMYPGVKMNPADVEALKGLDQQKISFAQPAAAANPYAQTAMNIQSMIRNASMGAMNAFVPPAAAAGEMPMAVTGPTLPASTTLLTVIGKLKGATSFRGTSQLKYKQAGDYQSNPRENFFFDFNPALVSRAQARARNLSEQDINALTFTVLTEAGPTRLGKLEVAANLINRSAANKNIPIVSVAKAPGQYEGVFNYKPNQLISASEGRRIFGSAYDQVRKLITRGR
jgi:hypothetical protein